MRRFVGWRTLVGFGVVFSAFLVFGAGSALAAFHGIATAKGCTSPVKIGDPYTCAVQISNSVDTGHDTVRVTGLSDTVNSAGGAVPTGNILGTTGLVFSGAVVCSGGSGSGTFLDPYLGATECLLPFGTSITTKSFSHYTVQANDFNLPLHRLTDTASVNWNNTCTFNPDNDCSTLPQIAGAGSSALINKLNTSTATDIHNAAHQAVTVVEARSTVHDFVTVTGQPNNPVPTGNVNIDWFLNGTCTGAAAANSGSIGPLNASGQLDATGFAFTVNSPGFRSFKAHYEGDSLYNSSDGDCEPLRVVDANVQITPDAINPVGTNHVFTGHVNVNDGTGFTNAPDGTIISFFLHSGPGGFVGNDYCVISGGTGSCTVTISSPTPGTNVVSAHVAVAVAGLTLTRHSDAINGNSGNATKLWADDTVRTDIHDANHNVITTASTGNVVHDKVFVERLAGTPAGVPDPTGTVIFHRYATANCTGAATDETKTLAANGTVESSDFTTVGDMSYKAHYNGDANYPARDGACEPLAVTLPCPAGGFTGTTQANGDFTIVYDQFPAPNDNSYGVNAVGWPNGHTFNNLTGSDKPGYEVVHNGRRARLLHRLHHRDTVRPAPASGVRRARARSEETGGQRRHPDAERPDLGHFLARNLNNIGYFAGGAQKPATITGDGRLNLLADSPPTLNTTDSYVLKTPNPWTGTTTYPENGRVINGWDFHDTYFVTLKAAKLVAIGAEDPITHQLNPGGSSSPT